VADQEDLATIVQHDAAHAEGHAAREAEIDMQQAGQQALRECSRPVRIGGGLGRL
jgi:hypothetical protein